jgi:hypothetical protein
MTFKISRQLALPSLLLAGCAVLISGCATLVEDAMQNKNQQDLKNGRQSPSEYQNRRNEIDRKLG